MKRFLLWACPVAFVGALATGGTAAYAALTAAAPVTYHACLKAGLLSEVGTKTPTCPVGARAIAWNQAGVPGSNGKTILSGKTTPSAKLGVAGDFYIDRTTHTLYGPKTSTGWPSSGTSLVGPAASACQVMNGSTSYTDLQTALNDAASEDTLVVSGTCEGTFRFSPASASTLTIEGSPVATLNGASLGTVLTVGSNATLVLDNLVVTGGSGSSAVGPDSSGCAGGIDNGGTLTLEGSAQVNNNTASVCGGGIANTGTLTLEDSSQVNNNTASEVDGGGITNIGGTLTLEGSSQVDSNTAGYLGGGIFTNGTVTLEGSSQVDNNTAAGAGGVASGGTLTMEGSSQVDSNTASTNPGLYVIEGTFSQNPNTGDDSQIVDNNT